MSLLTLLGLLMGFTTTDVRSRCYTMTNGADYRGTVHFTYSGIRCQKWTSQTPHSHTRTPENYPGRGLGDHNFCRNPDNDTGTGWCYTMDPSKRWEYCNIGRPEKTCDKLSRNCYTLKNGADYRGTVDFTNSGITCQNWTSQTPHSHTRTPDNYLGRGLGDHNFCRNPDNDDTGWCYTMDPSKRWQYCSIGRPEKTCDLLTSNCYTSTNGADYRGTVHFTKSGIRCQKWTSQEPHTHTRTPANYPGKGLGDHDLCRNPDNDDTGWCYTMDPSKRWEYCNIGSPQKTCVLDVENCGIKMIGGEARIVRGKDATPGSWPWQAQVMLKFGGHYCGGTLISEDYVISAAHCFSKYSKNFFKIRLGEHDRSLSEGSEQTFDVECVIIHPQYNSPVRNNNDIALVKLKRKSNGGAQFGQYVAPACLPWQTNSTEQFNAGHDCWISGWGSTRAAGISNNPDILQEGTVPLLGRSVCRRQNIYGNRLTDKMFCAGHLKGGTDTCRGDSGGPLVCERDGVWTLYGVTSWGYRCAQTNKPGVYTRVSEYINWITQKVTSNACE